MKFGGTSVADASRIRAVADLVRERLARRPVVVVSALAGVTDLLVRAVHAAWAGDRDALDPVLSDLERRHRWAVAGAIEAGDARHDLALEVDARFEELRQLLRSLRVLGEATARSTDAVLAYGEDLSSRIVAAALAERGVPARPVDPRTVMLTDGAHGGARPDEAAVGEAAARHLRPLLAAGEVPVLGGFVGATAEGRTTTLGRGGSDLTASLLGAQMGAEEIQIWTDVDGILSADPRLVEGARTRESVSFAEAAELAHYGAKVLHPASVAPALSRDVPVRVLNALNPGCAGTLVRREPEAGAPALAAVASRSGVCAIRVRGAAPQRALAVLFEAGLLPDVVAASQGAVTVVAPQGPAVGRALAALRGGEPGARAETVPDLGVLCVVGSGLARAEVRAGVLRAVSEIGPLIVAVGASETSVAAVLPTSRLGDAVRRLHRRFFEEVPA